MEATAVLLYIEWEMVIQKRMLQVYMWAENKILKTLLFTLNRKILKVSVALFLNFKDSHVEAYTK